ncbi:MAG: hypothetical protein OXN89_08725, partial [Bryobacterales bacterium]|nr:hypothetical protein [Bryobacterales bacterium]
SRVSAGAPLVTYGARAGRMSGVCACSSMILASRWRTISSERTLRGPVISCYLSFGSGGPNAAKTAGLLLGVLETVRLAWLNAYTWVRDRLEACQRNRGRPPTEVRAPSCGGR